MRMGELRNAYIVLEITCENHCLGPRKTRSHVTSSLVDVFEPLAAFVVLIVLPEKQTIFSVKVIYICAADLLHFLEG